MRLYLKVFLGLGVLILVCICGLVGFEKISQKDPVFIKANYVVLKNKLGLVEPNKESGCSNLNIKTRAECRVVMQGVVKRADKNKVVIKYGAYEKTFLLANNYKIWKLKKCNNLDTFCWDYSKEGIQDIFEESKIGSLLPGDRVRLDVLLEDNLPMTLFEGKLYARILIYGT